MNDYSWVLIIGLIFVGTALLYKDKKDNEYKEDVTRQLDPNVTKIESPKQNRSFPLYYDVILLILSAVLFIGAGYQIVYWIINGISLNVLGVILFVLAYMGIPVLIWINTCYKKRKHQKEDKSGVFAENTITHKFDSIEDAFNTCYEKLKLMGAEEPINLERPKFIQCPKGRDIISIDISIVNSAEYNIHITSDSKVIDTNVDWCRNKRNVKKFTKLIISAKLKSNKRK
jgi:hypothetical protein